MAGPAQTEIPQPLPGTHAKLQALEAQLRQLGNVMVAYSGGVDSAFLAATAHRVLGDRMLAVLADSPSLARRDMEQARAFAKSIDMPLRVILTEELDKPEYQRNDANRCFHCKTELFDGMKALGAGLGYTQHRLRHERRRYPRLPARAARRAGTRSAGAAGRCRFDQARSARPRQGRRISAVGSARGAVPVFARGIRPHRHSRSAAARWSRPKKACANWGSASSACAITANWRGSKLPAPRCPRRFRWKCSTPSPPRCAAPGFQYITLDCAGFRSGSLNAVYSPPKSSLRRGA